MLAVVFCYLKKQWSHSLVETLKTFQLEPIEGGEKNVASVETLSLGSLGPSNLQGWIEKR